MKVTMDGGGFPIFSSYHDYRLQSHELIGRTPYKDKRAAFEDFKRALEKDPNWRGHFTHRQVEAIQRAMVMNNPVIDGFTWHHHQDWNGETMQLIDRTDHRETGHTGGWAISRR